MKALLLVPAVLLTMGLSAKSQTLPSSPGTDAIRRQIETTQQAIGQAIRAHDFATLEKFWSPQMVVNAPENTIRTREDVFVDMRSGGLNYTSLRGTTESFHVFGDTAIEMGHEDFVMAAGPSAGKPLQRRFTNVWQRSGDHWVQIARQATILNADVVSVYGPPAPLAHQP